MKVQVKGLLKAIFCDQKGNKKADKFCVEFSSTSNIVHDLEPKKMGICSGEYEVSDLSDLYNIDF